MTSFRRLSHDIGDLFGGGTCLTHQRLFVIFPDSKKICRPRELYICDFVLPCMLHVHTFWLARAHVAHSGTCRHIPSRGGPEVYELSLHFPVFHVFPFSLLYFFTLLFHLFVNLGFSLPRDWQSLNFSQLVVFPSSLYAIATWPPS